MRVPHLRVNVNSNNDNNNNNDDDNNNKNNNNNNNNNHKPHFHSQDTWPLIWWGVLGMCQSVDQRRCRAINDIDGGSS